MYGCGRAFVLMVFSGPLSKCRVISAGRNKPESWKETCFPVGMGPPEPVVSTPGIQEHHQNCLVGPTPNGKHHKYACTPASFHESGQEVACSPEQMQGARADSCCFPDTAGPTEQFWRCFGFECREPKLLALGGPPRPESTISARARPHLCMIQARVLLARLSKYTI